jgi:AcrR family transcriptional regulator
LFSGNNHEFALGRRRELKKISKQEKTDQSAKQSRSLPRERIMSVAADLFYKQGYRATGVNEVIEKSGVAKATFYSHFPSKDDLALAYLRQLKDIEIAHVDNTIWPVKDALNTARRLIGEKPG